MWAPKFKFYHDEPLFGLDIGHTTMKVLQLSDARSDKAEVVGYGVSNRYSEHCVGNGIITDYDTLSKAIHELFEYRLVGSITSKRVVCTLPNSHTFSRPMRLPLVSEEEISEAVHLEAEQYIPVPTSNLYLDYEIYHQDDKGIELIMVATPKDVVDSHLKFLESVGLEPVVLEPTMSSTARIFRLADPSHTRPTVLIDVGSTAIDIAVFDKAMFVNSTINGGGDTMNELIAKQLNVDYNKAFVIKCKYGISSHEKSRDISGAIIPTLELLVREVKKIIRYYNDRSLTPENKVAQIVTVGGGATMRGLSEYLSQQMVLPAHILNPWHKIGFDKILTPHEFASSLYITVAGAALLNPKDLFND
jgi:type IV pilus assembly protein PilM